MPYPEHLVAPMRADLTRLGISELNDTEQVDAFFEAARAGTSLLVINSVCGCAAANARPGVAMALQTPVRPDRMATVFAGQDLEATAQARTYLVGIAPSSPFVALLRDGDPVFILERRHIEGRSAAAIATDLVQAFQRHCADGALEAGGIERPDAAGAKSNGMPSTFRSIL